MRLVPIAQKNQLDRFNRQILRDNQIVKLIKIKQDNF